MHTKKIIALVCALSLLGACTVAGQSINSAAALKAYLDKQPANSPDQPITAVMNINEAMIEGILEVIWESGKYVSLDLACSPLTEIPDIAFAYCANIAGITLPAGLTRIGDAAFSECTNIAAITIPAGVTAVGGSAFWGWTASQTIIIEGKANRDETIAAGWYDDGFYTWDAECNAVVVYKK